MSNFEIKSYGFDRTSVETLGTDIQEFNWPVVYQIYNSSDVYIGETTNLKGRMGQHLQNKEKDGLEKFSVIFDKTFNKSAALDLEAQLIQWFSGDGKLSTRNKNSGLVDRDYYQRPEYRKNFPIVWEKLQNLHIATKSIKEIENSGLFKFSPYKQLNEDQARVVEEILIDLEEAIKNDRKSISIIGGSEGTGKTIVIMYLIKLIRDIQDYILESDEDEISDENFGLFFQKPFADRLRHKSLALVVPNQSLKGSISKVLKGISNMGINLDLLSPIEFGSNEKTYDITFVDEAHLLKISNQEVHKANREKVDRINSSLFKDEKPHTEFDWIIAKSNHVVMVYGDQRVRPNNITKQNLLKYRFREHLLKSQMRSKGGELYINYLREVFSNDPPEKMEIFTNFEFKLFDDFSLFTDAIYAKEQSYGLSRMVAGFAWDWKSKNDKTRDDITIDGIGLKWNSVPYDWVGSKNSVNEVGSIYTIQGYDLNYCGVIIGNDLKYDPLNQRLIFNKSDYFDRGAKKRTKYQIENKIKLSHEEILDQIIRTYRILMNRSIKGTYLYVMDGNLRKYLKQFIDVI